MPDIRNYFGANSGKDKKRTIRRVIDDDEDDVSVKRPKNDPDLVETSASDFFSGKAKSSSPELEEIPKPKTRSSPRKAKEPEVAKEPVKAEVSPKKASPKKAKESPKKKAAPAGQGAVDQDGETAEQILATIADAPLPDVDTSKKFNFHELKAKQADAPQPSGEVEIPEAAENCLAGLTFVFTGILPNLSREAGQDLVKRYGGKVTTSPSTRTSAVVLGEEAGPKKIALIKQKKIKAITEEGFLELLSRMPANGGGGEAAQKAMAKKAKEEEAIKAEAEKMAEEFEQAQKAQNEAHAKKTASQGGQDGGGAPQGPVDLSKQQLWTTKYAPTSLNHICGNKGGVEKLSKWLADWRSNAKQNFKYPGRDGYGVFRAAIIHGPPGIGKTTAAHLVANLQGFDVIENNASDTRSKSLLANSVAKTLNNTSLAGFINVNGGEAAVASQKNVCLIMDEVDGMSAGDRGGVGQMAALCRTTNIPIILICNDRSLPKMRPFDRVTYDIPFRRPDANAIRSRIFTICHREGIKVTPQVVDQMVQATHSDIRQIINMLSTFSRTQKSLDYDQSKALTKAWEKNTTLKPFDITAKLLAGATFAPNSGMSLNDKIELYFHDHDFAPLMMQENYLNTVPRLGSSKQEHLELAAKAAESISDGDLVDRMIHGSQQQWSLMPLHGVLSTVRPASFVAGQGRGRYNFSSFLGQNSKAGKYSRLVQEVSSHARLRVSGDKTEVRLQYLPLLTYRILNPLLEQGSGGVDEVIDTMDNYYLTKEDWDVIMELGVGPKSGEALAKGLPTAVKTAFTRKYNASDHPVPFMKSAQSLAVSKKVSVDKPDFEDVIEQEPEPEDDKEEANDDDDISKDKYIKVAKPKAKRATKASAAKGKAASKGKGKAKA
uniref:Replication factor C subunit 1 n=1 Tax=Blastobotrys adeninivorans TaxID=409370 RepID=A0A060T2G1_BLAAD